MKHLKKKFSFVLIFLSLTIMLTTLLISNNFIYAQTTLFKNINSISNGVLNINSSQFSEIGKQIYKESISEMLPANIELQYNESNYFGELVSYKYREGYTFSALKEEQRTFDTGKGLISIDIPFIKNLTKYISNNVITIYVFVATATTIPKIDEQVSGYVIYAYNIYIK